jgi:Flp pilus assembly protein TadG
MSAMGMLAFILSVGMCVDVSHFYLVKGELQNAVDASALAGASALNSSGSGITEAVNRAVGTLNSYEFNNQGITLPRANVKFSVNLDGPYVSEATAAASPQNIRFVSVATQPTQVNVFFAGMVLGSSQSLSAQAVAGMSVPTNVICNWLPVSVIDYDAPIVPGGVYTFRSAPSSGPSPGNYQVLAVAGNGGQDERIGLASGVDACASPGAVYNIDTKPGVTSGPTRQGINTRFDDYSTSQVNPMDEPPDTNIAQNITYAQYRDGTVKQSPSHPGVPGRRIVVIPIIKKNQYDQGRNTVTFDRFGLFFLQNAVGNGNGGDIKAEYISDPIAFGKGSYDPNGGAANALLTVPVLYK